MSVSAKMVKDLLSNANPVHGGSYCACDGCVAMLAGKIDAVVAAELAAKQRELDKATKALALRIDQCNELREQLNAARAEIEVMKGSAPKHDETGRFTNACSPSLATA